MRLLIILFPGLFFASCKTTKPVSKVWNEKSFIFLETKDTINLKVTFFIQNPVTCFTEAIPYALLIGQTDNPKSPNIPKLITVLAKCDNNSYEIGQKIKVLPIKDPTINTTLRPLYIVKDTLIDNQKHRWLVGSENSAIWGKVL